MEISPFVLSPIVIFNIVLFWLFTIVFFYQYVYVFVGFFRKEPNLPEARKNHRYAVMIAAHNEEAVIGELIDSLRNQNYPSELIDVYVIADACTDNTAKRAREHGAVCWERNDLARKGKSWALDMGFNNVLDLKGDDYYDAYLIFDADNIVSPDYVKVMNRLVDKGYLVGTSYRNSKNFDSTWISSAYALWFMREARYLNNARMNLHTSCAISGSGWLVSNHIIKAMRGWDFHTLTEDIQFSAFCAANGVRIGYAPAEFFDEQPLTLKASWIQRMRWTKGFYQVFFSYGGDLCKGIGHLSWASYDLFMTIAPGNLLTLLSVIINGTYLFIGYFSSGFLVTSYELELCVGSIIGTFVIIYLTYFIMGVITTITEYRHIHARKRWRIYTNLFTFPFFFMTYIPMNVIALFKKVEWIPTKHEFSMSFDDVVGQ